MTAVWIFLGLVGACGVVSIWMAVAEHAKTRVDAFAEIRLPRDVSEKDASARPKFIPFATCPGCGLQGHHLLSESRTVTETDIVFRPDPNDPGEVVEISVWHTSKPIHRIVNGGGAWVDEPRPVSVVDRECLACGKKWEEAA